MIKISKTKSIFISYKTTALMILIGLLMLSQCSCGSTPLLNSGDLKPNDQSFKGIEDTIKNAKEKGANTVNMVLGENPDIVQDGDLVALEYSLYSENNELICSNIHGSGTIDQKYANICNDNNNLYETLWVAAGKPDILPGLHSAIIDMEIGQSKRITIPPENAYGNKMDDKIMKLSSIKKVPRFVSITEDKFQQEFHKIPSLRTPVKLVPYFNHRVTDISENEITLEADIHEIKSVQDEFGTAEIKPEDNYIVISLDPEVGAEFMMSGRKGLIVSKSENQFTVDFNHILAGEQLTLEVKILSINKLSEVLDRKISWFEDYDEGLKVAGEKKKPSVIVLYSHLCGWCKKLLTETMNDPRVTKYKDDFIWVKASDEMYPELMDVYGQSSYPAVIFIGSQGEEIEKISGFKYAPAFRKELTKVLHIDNDVKKNS